MLPGDAEIEAPEREHEASSSTRRPSRPPLTFSARQMDTEATEATPLNAPESPALAPVVPTAEPIASSSMSAASASATASDPTPISLSTTFQNGTTREWSLTYFQPPSTSGPSAAAVLSALPDSYFSPTPSELQTAFAGQVRKREQLVDRPLLTKALREREEGGKMEERRKRWPETRIRIRFADRSLLEGTLKSTDLLGAVYEMVKAALHEDVRAKPFVLCQSFAAELATREWGADRLVTCRPNTTEARVPSRGSSVQGQEPARTRVHPGRRALLQVRGRVFEQCATR